MKAKLLLVLAVTAAVSTFTITPALYAGRHGTDNPFVVPPMPGIDDDQMDNDDVNEDVNEDANEDVNDDRNPTATPAPGVSPSATPDDHGRQHRGRDNGVVSPSATPDDHGHHRHGHGHGPGH